SAVTCARPPAAAISATSGASFSTVRRATTVVKPPAANRRAIAAPMKSPAPTMSATSDRSAIESLGRTGWKTTLSCAPALGAMVAARAPAGALAPAVGELALLACEPLDLRPTRIEVVRDLLVVAGELTEVGIGEAEDAHLAVGAADLVAPQTDVLHRG